MNDMTFWILWTVFVFLVVFNFLPAVIAYVDRHPERRTLAMLNVASLFSFALWIALMVWATRGKRDDSVINRFMNSGRNRKFVQLTLAGIMAFSFGSTLGTLGIA
ncbi:MAG: superinfection immunity protein [Polymorphobacter sp.]